MARHSMFVSTDLARRELGFVPGSVAAALERAVRWYEANGYVGGRSATGFTEAHAA
jgi:nucleoside-diphosphate-sugar epimerase